MTKQITELRYALLMRVSTKKQTTAGKKKKAARSGKISTRPAKEEETIPEQKTNMMKFIEEQPEARDGIKWVDSGLMYVEDGVSAYKTHTSKRKGLQEAFEAAKNKEYDILIVYKLDRFGRRSAESLDMAMKFIKHCRIWVVDKKAEFKGENEIMNFVEFWHAKQVSKNISKVVTDAMINIHEEGYWTGGNPPYGFENHPEKSNMLKAIPEEAEVVKEIFDLYVNHGYGYLKISAHLNEKGVKSKTGGSWSSHTIRKIIINTVHKGHLSYGKTSNVEGEFGTYQKSLKNGEGTVSPTYWEEYDIVGASIWDQAQEIRNGKVKPNAWGGKTPSNKATGKGLLIGILRCECGGHMTYSTCSDWTDSKRTHKKEPYGIYRCQTRLKKGVAACGAKKATYRVVDLDTKIIKQLSKYTAQLVKENEIQKIRAKTEAATENLKGKIENVQSDITRYTKAKENANAELMKIMSGLDSDIPKNQATEIYKMAEKELDRLEKQLAEYDSLKSSDNMNEVDMMKLEDYISNWEFIFNHGTNQQKRNLIHSIASEIIVTKEKITITNELDIPKFFEFITSIKSTAKNEIAASLEAQRAEASESSLYIVDSRSTDSTQKTGMESIEYLSNMYSSDANGSQITETETKAMFKKLTKAFGEKVKNKITIGA